eukprot:3994169-Amphidinium_carterae.2
MAAVRDLNKKRAQFDHRQSRMLQSVASTSDRGAMFMVQSGSWLAHVWPMVCFSQEQMDYH